MRCSGANALPVAVAAIGTAGTLFHRNVQGAMPRKRQAARIQLVRQRQHSAKPGEIHQPGTRFRAPRLGTVVRRIGPITFLGDVERNTERLGIVAHHCHHVAQIVVVSIQPANHDVRIHMQHIGRRTRLESGEQRRNVPTLRRVRVWAIECEPSPMQRRGGTALVWRFDDPIQPTGVR